MGLFSTRALLDIAIISAAICEMPIASVTVLDKETQYTLAYVGLLQKEYADKVDLKASKFSGFKNIS